MLLYFDPGLGAMIAQALVAAFAGIVLFTKSLKYKILHFFGLRKNEESADEFDNIDIEDDK